MDVFVKRVILVFQIVLTVNTQLKVYRSCEVVSDIKTSRTIEALLKMQYAIVFLFYFLQSC